MQSDLTRCRSVLVGTVGVLRYPVSARVDPGHQDLRHSLPTHSARLPVQADLTRCLSVLIGTVGAPCYPLSVPVDIKPVAIAIAITTATPLLHAIGRIVSLLHSVRDLLLNMFHLADTFLSLAQRVTPVRELLPIMSCVWLTRFGTCVYLKGGFLLSARSTSPHSFLFLHDLLSSSWLDRWSTLLLPLRVFHTTRSAGHPLQADLTRCRSVLVGTVGVPRYPLSVPVDIKSVAIIVPLVLPLLPTPFSYVFFSPTTIRCDSTDRLPRGPPLPLPSVGHKRSE